MKPTRLTIRREAEPENHAEKTQRGCSQMTAYVRPMFRNGVDQCEQRMVLIGKTGVGKSAAANTILGDNIFKSKTSPTSVTAKCHFDRRERFGKKILVVDTPGLFDTSTPKDTIEIEVKKCISISAPGPHAFLLVMSFSNRFTEEEQKVLNEVTQMFGGQMVKYLIVLFTGRDHLEQSSSVEHHIKEYLEEYPEDFRSLVQKAGGGYVTFNNRGKESEKEDDVQKLLKRMDEMVKRNGGGHFTSEMFEAAENVIQQRITNELAIQKEEIRKEVEEEMRRKYDDELSRMKTLRKEDVLKYQILKRELDQEQMKNEKNVDTERNLKGAFRPLIIEEMRENAEHKLMQQIEKCEGAERAEVHRQLAGAGLDIQQRHQGKSKRTEADASEEEGEAEDENQESETNEFQENADRATEQYLAEFRDNERGDIANEKGALQKIKKKMSGLLSPFLSLFK